MNKKLILVILTTITVFAFIFLAFLKRDNVYCSKKDYSVCVVDFNGSKLKLTVVYTDKAKEKGLMFVEGLKKDTGMLFVYDREQVLAFWMKNTLIPLSIAFVKANGKIVKILDMYPEPYANDYTFTRYYSAEKVQYAIEAPLGWFLAHKIQEGTYIKLRFK